LTAHRRNRGSIEKKNAPKQVWALHAEPSKSSIDQILVFGFDCGCSDWFVCVGLLIVNKFSIRSRDILKGEKCNRC